MVLDMPLKATSLVLQVAFNLSFGIVMAACRKRDVDGHVFFGPTAVFLMEVGKLFVSIIGVSVAKLHGEGITVSRLLRQEQGYDLLGEGSSSPSPELSQRGWMSKGFTTTPNDLSRHPSRMLSMGTTYSGASV